MMDGHKGEMGKWAGPANAPLLGLESVLRGQSFVNEQTVNGHRAGALHS